MNDSHPYQNPDSTLPPREKGDSAEDIAADYLTERGYRIRDRNSKAAAGEIDLVAEKGRLLVFVEVRYRRSVGFGSPEETVTPAKQRRVVLSALEYACRHKLLDQRVIRFDVLSVLRTRQGPRIEHLEDAFDADLPGGGPYCWR